MAFLHRYLITIITLLTGFAAEGVRAQEPLDKPVTFRTLAIGNTIGPFFCDLSPGKPSAISAGHSELSQSYARPKDGVLEFYSEGPPDKPGGKPRRIPLNKVNLGKGGPYLVLLFQSSEPTAPGGATTNVQAFDDSWDAHPLGTVRVLNFSKKPAAIQIGSTTAEVAVSGMHIFSYPSGKGYLSLKVAMMEDGNWSMRWNSAQGIVPGVRPTFVITDMAPTPEDPNPVAIDITSIFDVSPPPPGGT